MIQELVELLNGNAELAKVLGEALQELLEKDRYLLEHNLNERTITHRLASYLQRRLEGWDVDCEYNRNHDNPKTLPLPREDVRSDDTEARTVFPDIIVHHRGSDENVLVIELKKSTNPEGRDRDLLKLALMRRELHYRHALFIRLQTGHGEAGIDEILSP